MVLTGTDALAAGIDQKIWVDLLPDHASSLPNLDDDPAAGRAQDAGLAQGQGVIDQLLPVAARCSNTCPTA